jgi:Zn-dependent M28 family amino/carboxypeptidase
LTARAAPIASAVPVFVHRHRTQTGAEEPKRSVWRRRSRDTVRAFPIPKEAQVVSTLIRRGMLLVGAAVLTTGIASAQPPGPFPTAVEAAAKTYITRNTLEAPIRFLASDALEGRGPATRGDELARLYLATQLESLGYQAGGPNGQWQQPFDVVAVKASFPKVWSFQAAGGAVDLKWWDDYIAGSGVQQPQGTIDNAELVFVGYGIEAPEFKWNDFKGRNMRGKVLVMLNNDPDWDPNLFAGKRRLYYGRWSYKYESAARQGAAGAIIIHTTPSAGYPWQVVQSSWSGTQFSLPDEGEARIQVKGWATEEAMRRLMKAGGKDLDKLVAAAHSRNFKPVPLGIRTSLAFANELSRTQTANVAGLLPGSDPKLKSEVVVYSAHHDHFGIGAPDASGDKIYHGAEDNASGCAQLLAMARAFASLPEKPRRSILILFVAVEEQGLLGSLYYALHPTIPPGKIAADINYDGGNIFGRTHDVTLVSSGKSSLDKVVEAVAQAQNRVVKPDQFPDRGYYYRSDQFSFAKVGVPGIYLDSGTDFIGRPADWGRQQKEQWEETHYHQPSDRLDGTWNFDGMVEDAQLGFFAGWLIAQAAAMPKRNRGDEFEAARKKALAAIATQ